MRISLPAALALIVPLALVAGGLERAASAEEGEPSSPAAAPAAPPAPAPAPSRPERPTVEVHGLLDARYVVRSAREDEALEDTSDQDIYGYGRLETRLGEHVFVEASGRLDADIDGQRTPALFQSIDDTHDDSIHGYLYTAFLEARRVGIIEVARGGRQRYDHGVDVAFDGARVDLRPLGSDALTLVAYGGVPVHYYESSHSGDALAGGAIEVRPWRGGAVRFDYAHVTDRRPRGDRHRTRDDDLFRLGVEQRVTKALALRAAASTFEGRSTRAEGEALVFSADWDVALRLRYVAQLGAFRLLSIDFTPLDAVLDRYEPYHEVSLTVTKGVGAHLNVGGGIHVRRLMDDDDEGPFNHEFERYHASITVLDWPIQGLTLTATGEHYQAEPFDDRFSTVTGEVAQAFPGGVSVSFGSSYALYRFDEFFLEEREDVRTYFGRIDWEVRKGLKLCAAFEHERDDEAEYDTYRFGARLAF